MDTTSRAAVALQPAAQRSRYNLPRSGRATTNRAAVALQPAAQRSRYNLPRSGDVTPKALANFSPELERSDNSGS